MNTNDESVEPQVILRLAKDLKDAVTTLNPNEVRFLVDSYYQMQENRIRCGGQIRAMTQSGEPHAVLLWLEGNSERLENQVRLALSSYAKSHPVGRWAMQIKGIGPVITAGLLAHIDITKCPTVGHIWSFAGLDPTKEWKKGEKRPWNASLKTLCWKIGESFVKVSGYDDAYYGKAYLERKAIEIVNNDAGKYKEQAEKGAKRVGKDTEAYKHYTQGKLPPGHIHARAKRWAVKLFLAHLFEEWYRQHHGKEPPLPYPIAILGHAHVRKAA